MLDQPRVDILVVDDSPASLMALEAALVELGQNVVTATSGREALKRLLTQEFAVIVLDIRMPDMDGFETASLIRTRDRTRATPIIFLTAQTPSDELSMQGYKLGAVDFLHKPIVPDILKSKVTVFVELHRKTIEIRRQGELLRDLEKKEHVRALAEARRQWEAEALRADMEQSRKIAEALAAKNAELAVQIKERERAEEAQKQLNQRLRLLSEAANRLLMGASAHDVLAALFEPMAAHIGLDVYMSFMQRNGSGLELDGFGGISEESARETAHEVCAITCDVAARERRRIVLEELDQGDHEAHQVLRTLGFTTIACFPLLTQGRLVGTLFFASRRRPRFEIEELAVMQVCCDQLAIGADRARLLAELEKRADQLAEADRRKDEFLAMLGHELRNPLAPMVTALQIMKMKGTDDPAVMKARRAMDRQLQHIVRLVDDLLDVSRINRGKIELKRGPVELEGVLEHALQTSRPLIEDHGHSLAVRAPQNGAMIDVDPTRLSQVISNLLNNAAKYTPRGGHVWLDVDVDGRDVAIKVRDDGIGVDGAMLGRIFDMFVQSPRGADRSLGGLGIGLTLVKRLVELHGGSVSADSLGKGQGAEFTVHLPGVLVVEPTDEDEDEKDEGHDHEPSVRQVPPVFALGSTRGATTSSPPTMTPLHILVVEDNSDIRDTLRDLLVMCGHQVDVAEDGERGLEMILEREPQVALIDIGLPGLDGYRVARALKDRLKNGRKTRLIALTGYGQPDDRRRALDAGFDAHLVKPVDLEHLSQVLREHSPS
jgi:signal transduction histidine kinase/DNA-binding response OmpR family regulator